MALARLAGVRISADIYERAAAAGIALPLDTKRRARLATMRRAGVMFVHVPKNAGMAVSQALYGMQVKHASARYLAVHAPQAWHDLPSFAVVRDPVARFMSAYRYARAGGGADNRVSPVFADRYRDFDDIEAALDHVERAPSPFQVDHIFRPQCWYLTDRQGRIDVDHLVTIDRITALLDHLAITPVKPLERVNQSTGSDIALTATQGERIRRLYADDAVLFARVDASGGIVAGQDV